MTRYAPSRSYLWAGVVALALGACCGWAAPGWSSAGVAAALFLITAALLIFLGIRPSVIVAAEGLFIGNRGIRWSEILRVDRTGWLSPLVVRLTLSGSRRVTLIYPGDSGSSASLLRHIRRSARKALIDGVPYRQFWGDPLPDEDGRERRPASRCKVLRDEDEAEVERLYRRLKAVGHLDSAGSSEDK